MVKWQGREESSNIEDRRGQSTGGGLGGGGPGSNPFGTGGGGFRLPSGRSGGGLGSIGIIILFVIIAMAFGISSGLTPQAGLYTAIIAGTPVV